MTIMATAPVVGIERPKINSIVFASALGTIIEWYDFLIYATAATLVFNKAFFPTFDPLAGTLAALGSYAVGFLARPLGGALFGHFGDRLGRKSMLVLTLFIMGLSTFCIGLLPTYASIGVFAPILLIVLRLIQGIGLGGEWGGASLMVLEHAPTDKRGFYTSFVQIGFPIGLVLATLMFTLVSKLPEADFAAYGWRIPFLVSIVLLAVGTFVRSRIPETPVFEGLKKRDGLSNNPVGEVVGKNGKMFLIAVGLKLSEVSWVYMLTVFIVGYATGKLGLPKPMLLDAVLYAALLELISLPFFGWLSDRIGRRPLYIVGALFTIVFAFPLFWLVDSKSTALIFTAVMIAMNFGHGMMFLPFHSIPFHSIPFDDSIPFHSIPFHSIPFHSIPFHSIPFHSIPFDDSIPFHSIPFHSIPFHFFGPESCYFPELFGSRVRYTGASFGFQVSAAIGGGFAPIIATAMVGYLGGTTGVSVMMIVLGLITLTAALAAHETKGVPLKE